MTEMVDSITVQLLFVAGGVNQECDFLVHWHTVQSRHASGSQRASLRAFRCRTNAPNGKFGPPALGNPAALG